MVRWTEFADLRRDGRYALCSKTCPPPRHDDNVYRTGMIEELDDAPLRERLMSQIPGERGKIELWPGFDQEALVELHLLDRVLVTLTEARDGLPAGHNVWTP